MIKLSKWINNWCVVKDKPVIPPYIRETIKLPSGKKEFLVMKELLHDAEKYDDNDNRLPSIRILETLSEYIDDYIKKPNKD